MRVTGLFFLSLLTADFILISTSALNYKEISIEKLSNFSQNILAVKGKTNKTKCLTKETVSKDDTLFSYDKSDVLSSENCYHPQRDAIFKNISSYSSDPYFRGKFMLTFCLFYVLHNPPFDLKISAKQRQLIEALPVKEWNSERLFSYGELNEFLLTGTTFRVTEADFVERIFDRVFSGFTQKNPKETLFSKIYYYIRTHSYNMSGNAVILPYVDVCNIVPYYVNKTINGKLFYGNDSYIEENEGKFYIKASRGFMQDEQFVLSYDDIKLDNDNLMLKHGLFAKNNLYDMYKFNKIIHFENNKQAQEILRLFNKHKINTKELGLVLENDNTTMHMSLNFTANKPGVMTYKTALIYFDWYKEHHSPKGRHFKYRLSYLTFLLRSILDCINLIISKMDTDYRDYILDYQENHQLTQNMKTLKGFTMEKMHLLFKNADEIFGGLVEENHREIYAVMDRYTKLDPNVEF